MAWQCGTCGESVSDDSFQVCWSCGSARRTEGAEPAPNADAHPAGSAALPLPPPLPETDPPHERLCPSCHSELLLRGTVPVRLALPDEDWDLFPPGWEREKKLWGLEAWICRICRRVVLYEVRR